MIASIYAPYIPIELNNYTDFKFDQYNIFLSVTSEENNYVLNSEETTFSINMNFENIIVSVPLLNFYLKKIIISGEEIQDKTIRKYNQYLNSMLISINVNKYYSCYSVHQIKVIFSLEYGKLFQNYVFNDAVIFTCNN